MKDEVEARLRIKHSPHQISKSFALEDKKVAAVHFLVQTK